ncbi:hypothetical protein [Oceanicella sp. SM1341]|uniref:hypothetical protein n=1 Tax=Oceanicella sp. SM1341 TaxID=1548889 RepID=UPI000E477DA1|nr:hypothetical protein [Oceanicella sp. SM1341]
MANPVDSLPGGVSDALGIPASSKIPGNSRVRSDTGFLGVLTDVPVFGAPTATGQWIVGAARCRAGGIPLVTQASAGIGIAATAPLPPSTGPIRVQIPSARVRAL